MILMGADPARARTAAVALSRELGWPLIDAAEPDTLHESLTEALGRREHRVVASTVLSPGNQQTVRGELRGVRFVDLANHPGDPAELIRAVRHEFGV